MAGHGLCYTSAGFMLLARNTQLPDVFLVLSLHFFSSSWAGQGLYLFMAEVERVLVYHAFGIMITEKALGRQKYPYVR